MKDITSKHKPEKCTLAFSAYTCVYNLEGGQDKQLGFEFPLKTANLTISKAAWLSVIV